MLQDSVRTSLYQNAILSNSQNMFMNKTVMDLGGMLLEFNFEAGSGILSYFAVKAGADRVCKNTILLINFRCCRGFRDG